jgi:hypothetical protein
MESEKIVILCENCSQKLRVPRLEKKILVTCPTCKHQFDYSYVERDELIEELLKELGGYQMLRCLGKKQFFQTWQGHTSTWYAKESEGTEVVIKVYDTILWFWADLGMGSWAKVDIRPDLVNYCEQVEARFGLATSTNLAPWLRCHLDDSRRLLALIRPYYPCSLVEYLTSRGISNELRVFLEKILPILHTIAADLDNLEARGAIANVSVNNLFVRDKNVILTDWGTSYISELIRRHDCETKIMSQDNKGEDLGFITEPRMLDLPFSISPCFRLARTYFYLRTGHHLNHRSDLHKLAESEEQAIVRQAISGQFSSCSSFVKSLEEFNLSLA